MNSLLAVNEGGHLRRPMRFYLTVLALALGSFLLPHGAFAQTVISSVTASPDPFNTDRVDNSTITVLGTPAVTGLEVHIFEDDQATLVRSGLTLTEQGDSSGTYTALWNGRNGSNVEVPAGDYYMRVYSLATTTYIGPFGTISTERIASLIEIDPNPFSPDGIEEVTFRVEGAPNATDTEIYFYDGGYREYSLTEQPVGSGVYYTTTTLTYGTTIPNNGNRTVYVRTTDNTIYAVLNTTLQIATFSNFTVDSYWQYPTAGDTATFTATGVPGLTPRAIIQLDSERQAGMFYERQNHSAASAPDKGDYGWIYSAGDNNQNAAAGWAEGAPLKADGTPGQWRRLTYMPEQRTGMALVYYNDWLYGVAGYDGGAKSTVMRAPVNTDGSLGEWVFDASTLPATRYYHDAVATSDTLYVVGGYSNRKEVYYAPINPDGSLGTFAATSQLLIGRQYLSVVATDEWLYAIGGYGSAEASVERAQILPGGGLAAWEAVASLSTGRYGHGAAIANGHIVVADGYNQNNGYAYLSSIETTEILPDGTLGGWTSVGDTSVQRQYIGMCAVGDRVFTTGGYTTSASDTRGVEWADVLSDGSITGGSTSFTDYAVLDLVESPPGTYTGTWDLKDEAGNPVRRDRYIAYLYNAANLYYYQRSRDVELDYHVDSIVADPDPFLPEGDNVTTITVTADPGMVNTRISTAGETFAISETSPGVYVTTHNFVDNGEIVQPNNYTMYMYDEDNQYNATTGLIQIIHTAGVGASPTNFAPSIDEVTTFTLSGEPGQDLLIQIRRDSEAEAGMVNRRDEITHAGVTDGTSIYVVGGYGTGSANLTPEYTTLDGSANMTGWSPLSRMTYTREASAAVLTSTTLYIIGGYSTDRANVEYAHRLPSGGIQPWQETNSLPATRGIAPALTNGDYIYFFGGYSGGQHNEVYRAPINHADGSLGAWTQIGTLPYAFYGHQAVLVDDQIYLGGGYASGYRKNFYRATLLPDGSLSSWEALSSLNKYRYRYGLVESQGFLFAVGGEGESDQQTIERAEILPDGTLGAWELLSIRSPRNSRFAMVENGNGRIFLMGGDGQHRSMYYADVAPDGTLGDFQSDLWGELPMVEEPGSRRANTSTYRAAWDGRDALGNLAPSGTYNGRLIQSRTRVPFYGRNANVTIKDVLSSFEFVPGTFVPEGNNTATFRATGSPGQVGLYYSYGETRYLQEVSPGVYEDEFDFVQTNGIFHGETTNNTVYLYDANSIYTGLNTHVTIRHIRNLNNTPSPFYPTSGQDEVSTLTMDGEPDLELRATMYGYNERYTGLLFGRTRLNNSTFLYDDRAYIVGGEEYSVGYTASGEYFGFQPDGRKLRGSTLTPMNETRSYMAATAYNGWAYATGGYSGSSLGIGTVERAPVLANGRLGEWQYEASLNQSRYGHSIVVIGNYLYVMGGYSSGRLNSIERAEIHPDGSLGAWENIGTLQDLMYYFQAYYLNGYLYIFGGHYHDSEVHRAEVLGDGTLGSWEALSSFNYNRQSFHLVKYGDYFYAIGGTDGNARQNVSYAEILPDGTLGAWQVSPNAFPTYLQYAGGVARDGWLYAFGGNTSGQSYSRAFFRAPINPDGSIGSWIQTLYPSVQLSSTSPYSYGWDGRDSDGNVCGPGSFRWYVYHDQTGYRYPLYRDVTIGTRINGAELNPTILVADGNNVTTITVQGSEAVRGLYAHFFGPQRTDYYNGRFLTFDEVEAGVYRSTWNGIAKTTSNIRRVFPDGSYELRIYDENGALVNNTETLEIRGINDITTSPTFTPGGGALLPITLHGVAGLDPLVEIQNVATNFTVRTLPTIEASGNYAAEWDGRDENGNFTGPNQYRILAKTNTAPSEYYYEVQEFTVEQAVFNIEVAPNPFTPTGSNVATVTVLADPGQTGLTAEFTHPNGPKRVDVPLVEQGSVGTYVAEWDGKDDLGDIMPDGVVTIEIRDGGGDLFPISTSVTISTITRFELSPNPFTPIADPGVTVEVDMLGGLNLQARVGLVATIALSDSGSPGNYTGFWNGKDGTDNFAPAGLYNVTLKDVDSGFVFNQARTLTINEVDLTPPTATVNFDAPAPPLGPGVRTFTLVASEPLVTTPTLDLTPLSGVVIPGVFAESTDGGVNWPGAFDVPTNVQHGYGTLTFEGTDLATNTGTVVSPSTVNIDSRGPVITNISMSPSYSYSVGTGLKTVTIYLDEAVSQAPTCTFTPPAGSPVNVTLTGGPSNWTGSLTIAAGMGEGVATFDVSAVDAVGNIGTTINNGKNWTIDQTPPGKPSSVSAASQPNGYIRISWNAATGQPYNYQLYRQSGTTTVNLGSATLVHGTIYSNAYTDLPPSDGEWSYALTATDRVGNTGLLSSSVSATADRVAPNPPQNLTATGEFEKVRVDWSAPSGETPAKYHVYRKAGTNPITTTSGASRVASNVTGLTALVDPATVGDQVFAATAIDAAGNESTPSNSAPFFFETPLPAPSSLTIAYQKTTGAKLTWPAVSRRALGGYIVFRDGVRITPSAITATSYTDTAAPANSSALYGVRAVTDGGTPGDAREATHRPIQIDVDSAGLTIEPNTIHQFDTTLSNPAGSSTTVQSLKVEMLAGDDTVLENYTKTLNQVIAGGETQPVTMIVPIASYAAKARFTAFVSTGEPGATVSSLAVKTIVLRPVGTRLEIYPEPTVRGTAAEVRLRLVNASPVPIDILTALDGNPSPDVHVNIYDSDGTFRESASLFQLSGTNVINTPSHARAVLQPGDEFLTGPIYPVVPLDATTNIRIEGVVDQVYYHYDQADQVIGAGMTGHADSTPTETDYRATAEVSGLIYSLGTPIPISGTAYSNTTDNPVPDVDVKVGLSVRGFTRYLDVHTDSNGDYSTMFYPFSRESGHYLVWGVHPDVLDKPIQDEFDIAGLTIGSPVRLRMAKNSYLNFSISFSNLGELDFTGLATEWLPDPNATDIVTTMTLRNGTAINGDSSGWIDVQVYAPIDANSIANGTVRLTSTEGLNATSEIDFELSEANPILRADPSFIKTVMSTQDTHAAEIKITNVGFDDLKNARLADPSVPWIQYTTETNLGNIVPGGTRIIGIQINPQGTVDPGNYSESFKILSDNLAPYNINVFPTLTSSLQGDVLFQVEDVLSPQLEGARVEVRSLLSSLFNYEGYTDENGEWLLDDVPTGEYSYRVSAPGHTNVVGRVVVKADQTEVVRAFLVNQFVTVEWTVEPHPVEDRYEIKLESTFETHVPAPVLIIDPPSLVHLMDRPGTSYAEFDATNRGLIAGNHFNLDPIASSPGMRVELLVDEIDIILPMQTLTIPYRVVLDETASSTRRSSDMTYEDWKDKGIALPNWGSQRDLPSTPLDCHLAGQILAILDYICRLETITTGQQHAINPVVGAAAVGAAGALDPTGVACAAFNCNDCCSAILSPGIWNAAKCLGQFFPAPPGNSVVVGGGGDGGGNYSGGYGGSGGIGFSPCVPVGRSSGGDQ
ncbi:carboxypeptidase regulatory-like domain-containing protein [bacterium]|nr:carboxypeptidase regulatory-like domain-containing protein [bacterium]